MATSKLKNECEALIRSTLMEGFITSEKVVELVADMLSEDHAKRRVREVASSLLPTIEAERAAEMRSWPPVTDCDRLDAAFEELNALGIMARHDWTCCGTCGRTDIEEEFDALGGEWNGVPITGYAFYTLQGTFFAARGEGLHLYIDAIDDAKDAESLEANRLHVHALVCNVLTEHGLAFEWDGKTTSPTFVDMKWQRRNAPARFYNPEA